MSTNNPAALADIAAQLAPLGRRKFLLGLGAATGVVSVVGAAGCSTPPAEGLQHLTARQTAVFSAICAVVLPGAESELLPYTQLPMAQRIDDFYGLFPREVRELLATAVQMFDWGPWVIGWHWTRFTNLDSVSAVDYCERWQAGGVVQRGIFAALRQVALIAYWTAPETWPLAGYSGPTSRLAGLPLLGVTPYPGDQP